ncbi:MAG: carbonic anhydrase [Gemmatimonadota bacterium]
MTGSAEALERLREGNRRFAAGDWSGAAPAAEARRAELVDGQKPFAIVLGCSDSRVPPEIVLGQGLGDLFVIRVAGNVATPALVGSVEFAVEAFGTRLVVVLGHSDCGAVAATLESLERPGEARSPNLRSIVDRIRPSVEPLMLSDLRDDRRALLDAAGRAHIRASAEHLMRGSDTLARLIAEDGLAVVGAEYSLETGLVDFFG